MTLQRNIRARIDRVLALPWLQSSAYRLYPKPGNPNGTQDGEFEIYRR
jgi:hypothetical protein